MEFWIGVIVGVAICAFVLKRFVLGAKPRQNVIITRMNTEDTENDPDGDLAIKITSGNATPESLKQIRDLLKGMRKNADSDNNLKINLFKKAVFSSTSSSAEIDAASVREIKISVALKGVPARDGVKFDISADAGMEDGKTGVMDAVSAQKSDLEKIGRLAHILRIRLTAVVAGCDSGEILGNREAFAGIAKELLVKELAQDGIALVSFAIDDIKQAG
ncbi:MAG: hypothetical protein HZA48_10425 [Planctomycetes bacterium]|nr:hypothetical protein [Planctomycetota bacterium]